VTYPSGNVITYTFDYADRPYSAASVASTLVSSAAYLPFGPETQIAYGNGTTKTMLYDTRYRVQQNKLTGSSGVIAQYDYQEDAAGNITQIHDATDPVFNRDFAYDELQRLVTANSGASLWGTGMYSYDAMGNMLSTSVTPAKSFSYDGTTPKLLAVATVGVSHSLSYDAAGNETGYIANRTYSSRNQLLAVTDSSPAGHTISYGYDGRGIRVTRSESPVGTGTARSVFTYSPELNLLGVARDDAANYDIDWFGGRPLAQSSGTVLRYTFTDHLGTPILQTDATGSVIWRAEYDPYGDVRQMRVGASTDQPLRLPGQEVAMTSEGSEENYNIFRWYRSGWGRYTQADPLGLEDRTNLFEYARENSLRFTDRFGLWAIGKYPRDDEATVVCDGDGNPTPWVGPDVFPNPQEKKCVGECVLMHETSHINDINRMSPGVCRGVAARLKVMASGKTEAAATAQQNETEVRAYGVEFRCLQHALQRGGCCTAIVKKRMDDVRSYILLYGGYIDE
jgi:RHS repeat-associated protein